MKFSQDAQFAFRTLWKSPLITAAAAFSLALGIAANSTVFSLVYSILYSPLPYSEPDRLVHMLESNRSQGGSQEGVAPATYLDWKERVTQAAAMAAVRPLTFNLAGDGPPEQVTGQSVSADLFALLGVKAALGRTFVPQDGAPDQERTAVLSHGFWARRYGSDRSILSRTILLDEQQYSVIGVLPEEFAFLSGATAIWTPLRLEAIRQDRQSRNLVITARLAPGAAIGSLQQEMDVISKSYEEAYPDTHAGYGVQVLTLREFMVGDDSIVWILMGGVGFVLLIACANAASLQLARGEKRRQEVAVRAALGASSPRLIRQLLTESLMMASFGGLLGILFSVGGIRFLASLFPPNPSNPILPRLNAEVVIFTLAVTLISGLIFGLAPALIAARSNLAESLKGGGRSGTASLKGGRIRKALVVVQVSLALILLCGAGLLIQAFTVHQEVNPGFDTEHLLTINLSMVQGEDAQAGQIARFFEEVLQRLSQLPGVQSASTGSSLPRSSVDARSTFLIEGQPPPAPGQEPVATWLVVGPRYFETLGISLSAGRSFGLDDRADRPSVIIVSQKLAEQYFDGNALGKRIEIQGHKREVVGVASDVFQRRVITQDGAPPVVYMPHAQQPLPRMTLLLRSRSEPAQLTESVRQQIWRFWPSQPIGQTRTMTSHIALELDGPRKMSLFVLLLGIVALGLASVGIYGIVSYSVSLRRREIGIRMAMGANRMSIIRMTAFHGLRLMLIGILLALPGALGVWLLLRNLFTAVTPSDLMAPIGGTLLLAVIGLAASYFPARSAARVDPTETLRSDA